MIGAIIILKMSRAPLPIFLNIGGDIVIIIIIFFNECKIHSPRIYRKCL